MVVEPEKTVLVAITVFLHSPNLDCNEDSGEEEGPESDESYQAEGLEDRLQDEGSLEGNSYFFFDFLEEKSFEVDEQLEKPELYSRHLQNHDNNNYEIDTEIVCHVLLEELDMAHDSFLLIYALDSPTDEKHVDDWEDDVGDVVDSIERDCSGEWGVEQWENENGEDAGEEGVVDGDEEECIPDDVRLGGDPDDLEVTLDEYFPVVDLFLVPELVPLRPVLVLLLSFWLHSIIIRKSDQYLAYSSYQWQNNSYSYLNTLLSQLIEEGRIYPKGRQYFLKYIF